MTTSAHKPESTKHRIAEFRKAGLMQNLAKSYTSADIIASYLSNGSNNTDFSRLYGRISELLSQIIEDTELLEHLVSKDADTIVELMHNLRNDISMTLEGAIDEISRFASTPLELAEYVALIPSSNLDKYAQTLMEAVEMVHNFSTQHNPESDILHSKLNQNLISKIKRISTRLTQVEDLALFLQNLIREALREM